MFKTLGRKFKALFSKKIDEKTLEELEALFYQADLGAEMSDELTQTVRRVLKKDSQATTQTLLAAVKSQLMSELACLPNYTPAYQTPHVIMIVGTNGNGKTTSVAKLCRHFQKQGKSVLIAAADTFRAAATDQLELWATKLGAHLVKGQFGSDPAAICFDAIEAAKRRGIDVVLIDTAGRLHTKNDLMRELEKIRRVCHKALADSPHETLLVLDATIGQNGVEQALIFHKFTPLTGLILTKVDGTAKGGTLVSLQKKLKLPIAFLGSGEGVEDLMTFEKESFVDALLQET